MDSEQYIIKKKSRIIIIIILIMVISYIYYIFPRDVETSMVGIKYDKDNDSQEEVTIKFKGYVHRKVLKATILKEVFLSMVLNILKLKYQLIFLKIRIILMNPYFTMTLHWAEVKKEIYILNQVNMCY